MYKMLSRIILVIFVSTITMSLLKEEHITNINKDSAVFDDIDENLSNFNSPQKEQDIVVEMAYETNNCFSSQYESDVKLTNEWQLIISKVEDEDQLLKARIELMKNQNQVLGEKYAKLYEKSLEFNSVAEDIANYIMNGDRDNDEHFVKAKKILHPFKDKLVDSIKNFKTIIY